MRQRAEYVRAIDGLRARMGEGPFEAAWSAGRGLEPERLGSLIGSIRTAPEPAGPSATPHFDGVPAGLTGRQVEVLRLLTARLTNIEIAGRLDLSRHTVDAHLRSVYRKLDVRTRTAAARFAVEQGIV